MPTRNIKQKVRDYLVKGFVVLIPLIITLIVLSFALGFLANLLSPVTGIIESVIGRDLPELVSEIVAIMVLGLIIFVVGFVTELLPTAQEATDLFHALIESIPGIGSVYSSFRKMSETMMKGKDSFRDVKIAEYPSEGAYTIAFVSSSSNARLDEIAGENTTTLFIPMAPNPFMGGFVTSLPDSRVYDIDMTVQEGAKAIITSGVTLGDGVSTDQIELSKELEEFEEMIGDTEESPEAEDSRE